MLNLQSEESKEIVGEQLLCSTSKPAQSVPGLVGPKLSNFMTPSTDLRGVLMVVSGDGKPVYVIQS